MTDSAAWRDFNDAPDARPTSGIDVAALRAGLSARVDAVLSYLLPHGRIRHGKFHVGDVDDTPGRSLVVELDGPRCGLWTDFATGEGGDLIELWARVRGLSARQDFPRVAAEVAAWLGLAPEPTRRPTAKTVPLDDLGPYTGKWDYHNARGELIACVYRYDPPEGKEYRPWDARARLWRAPTPRPLYHQHGMLAADTVIVVEGEKCAQALIGQGLCATTAMNGARAPVDKTDWSPLAGKHVLIWPDRDSPGWDYAEAVGRAAISAGAASVAILVPPQDRPQGWDAADAVDEGIDVGAFLVSAERCVLKAAMPSLPLHTLGELLDDQSPIPADLITPRVLTPGGLLVFGGAPKVGKSDFLLAWLAHMAGGAAFLGMTPARPLRVFYLQAEVQYHYLRERVQAIKLPSHRLMDARVNLVATPQLRLVLDDDGVTQVIAAAQRAFKDGPPDVIVIDPIRNVFDGGEAGGENDNAAMLFFLAQRIERLRHAVNPEAGVILVHHTRKLPKKVFEEDPFQALAGAGSLRGYYSSGMMLFRPNEAFSARQLFFELRNGPSPPAQFVDKVDGRWSAVEVHERLVKEDYGAKLDAERRRKHDVILQLLYDEARLGRAYTVTQFAEAFENQAGLGGRSTVVERIGVLGTQGYIKFFHNGEDYGLPTTRRSKFGYLCVEGMALRRTDGAVDELTGEIDVHEQPVLPTHFKCRQSGAVLPVENPHVWLYQDEAHEPAIA